MAKSRKSRKVKKKATTSVPAVSASASPSSEYSKYTDEDMVRVLALYNLYHNQSEVARETGIPVSTVQRWVTGTDTKRRKELMGNFDQRVKQRQDELMHTMGFVASEALQQVHRRIGDASAAQAATIYGILFDKQQLMSGNAGGSGGSITFNINNLSSDDTAALMQRVLDRRKQSQAVEVDAQVVDVVSDTGKIKQSE